MNAIITELVDLIARGILLLGTAFVGSLAIRRCSAALVSCYWRVAIVSALLLPLVPTVWTFKAAVAKEEIVAPVVESLAPGVAVVAKPVAPPVPDSTPLGDATTTTARDAAGVSDSSKASALPPSTPDTSSGWLAPLVVIGLWFLGAMVVMGRSAVGVIRFRRLCREATPTGDAGLAAQFRELAGDVGLRRCPELLTHPRITIPMAGGLLKSRVLLPLDCARWHESDRAMVLVHELVHVRRRDALFHLLSSFAKAIHLVNPFAWIAARSMRDAAERATDDRVLERHDAAPSYARLLVEFASRQMATPCPSAPAGASSMAQPATVESRVHRILDPEQSRDRPRRIAVTSMAGVFALLLAGVGGSAFGEGDKPDSAPVNDGKELREKLESLIVPRVDFEGASLAEAVDFCTRKSREIDPDKQGVNMIVAPYLGDPTQKPADATMSLDLTDIPLGELLDYMATLSGRAIDIETHSVVFRGTQSNDLHTNIYPVDGELMESVLTWASAGEVEGGIEDPFGGVVVASSEPEASARHWLRWAGVSFPEGSSAFFEPFGSKLIVRNTRENLKLVDLVMRSMAGELDVGSEPSRAPIAERMRARVIPVIDFTEATLDEAVDYLRSQSGDSPINLVVLNRAWRADGEEEPRISLQLRDVPFEVALKYVSEFAGLTYRIDPHAVVIRSAWDEGLQLHTFPISNERLRQALGAEGGIGATQEWLAELGVGFPNGAAAYFEPMGANLIVRSNPAAIELIEKVLASIAEGIEVPMPREVGPPVGDPPGRLVPANRNLPPTELKLGAVPNVMQFDPAQLTVKAGASVELTFTNPGALPHNFLLLAPGSIDAVGDAANRMLSDAQNAAKLHYIPEEPEIRKLILAHTKVLQRAGSETIKFVAPAEPGTYPYICTFPGQWVLMRGQLVVEP